VVCICTDGSLSPLARALQPARTREVVVCPALLSSATRGPIAVPDSGESGSLVESAGMATKGELPQVGRALAHYDQEPMDIPSNDSPLLAIRGGHVVGLAERAWPRPFEADGIGLQIAVASEAECLG
jgi:hypothetical protein